ncbi:hypothetical protein H9L12_11520 [Sphingomonas rhizophila]|uniref:Uncharacterized protein n=1 Tax=Sphingomonas rhizophila TaxID=2071607 RepID=A0A7G9SAH5_9SPHN|nr:hypothetical protein [Sphingomonas rhizophila]QNN64850.1 hypothetical protein H9L12_11520 [Sphingomonas rhizophila]
MNASTAQPAPSWIACLAWALLLLIAGAALAIWGLSRWQGGARFFGVAPEAAATAPATPVRLGPPAAAAPAAPAAVPADDVRLATLESRLDLVENATERAEGTAGRANALLVAFAARRAIERGVALGYLEPLLIDRFGRGHERAVGVVITAGRTPQTLDSLVDEFDRIGPLLRGPAPNESWWTGFERELGSLVSIHRSDRPNPLPAARYERAAALLKSGKVDGALAETMRLPGASRPEAAAWIARARRQVLVMRALDEIESAALLGGPPTS